MFNEVSMFVPSTSGRLRKIRPSFFRVIRLHLSRLSDGASAAMRRPLCVPISRSINEVGCHRTAIMRAELFPTDISLELARGARQLASVVSSTRDLANRAKTGISDVRCRSTSTSKENLMRSNANTARCDCLSIENTVRVILLDRNDSLITRLRDHLGIQTRRRDQFRWIVLEPIKAQKNEH